MSGNVSTSSCPRYDGSVSASGYPTIAVLKTTSPEMPQSAPNGVPCHRVPSSSTSSAFGFPTACSAPPSDDSPRDSLPGFGVAPLSCGTSSRRRLHPSLLPWRTGDCNLASTTEVCIATASGDCMNGFADASV